MGSDWLFFRRWNQGELEEAENELHLLITFFLSFCNPEQAQDLHAELDTARAQGGKEYQRAIEEMYQRLESDGILPPYKSPWPAKGFVVIVWLMLLVGLIFSLPIWPQAVQEFHETVLLITICFAVVEIPFILVFAPRWVREYIDQRRQQVRDALDRAVAPAVTLRTSLAHETKRAKKKARRVSAVPAHMTLGLLLPAERGRARVLYVWLRYLERSGQLLSYLQTLYEKEVEGQEAVWAERSGGELTVEDLKV